MSNPTYHLEIDKLEHDAPSNTKRVMMYGWDADNLQPVRVGVNPDGTFKSSIASYQLVTQITASSTLSYLGKQDPSGAWLFLKIDTSGNLSKTYATVANNPTITTYADALTNYLTLTYGTPSDAL